MHYISKINWHGTESKTESLTPRSTLAVVFFLSPSLSHSLLCVLAVKIPHVDQVYGVERCDEFESNCETIWYMIWIQIKLNRATSKCPPNVRTHSSTAKMFANIPRHPNGQSQSHYSALESIPLVKSSQSNTYETCVFTPQIFRQEQTQWIHRNLSTNSHSAIQIRKQAHI